jgi:hypothetical protein
LYRLLKLVPSVDPSTLSFEDRALDDAAGDLRKKLKPLDFQHVMNAVRSKAKVFLTCDGGILTQRGVVKRLGVDVRKPSELAGELIQKKLLP